MRLNSIPTLTSSAIGPVFACARPSLFGQSLGNAEGDVDFVKAIQIYKESVILTCSCPTTSPGTRRSRRFGRSRTASYIRALIQAADRS